MPLRSMVRSPCWDKRMLTQRFSLSTQKRRYCRFGRKRRRVLLLAWETLFPSIGFLPATPHTRDMESSGIRESGGFYRLFDARSSLQEAALGEGHGGPGPNNEVVEHLDVHQRQGLLQGLGQRLVGAARFGNAGGVVMGKNHR